ncbi:RNA 2',3'-cyclic phosphodiesterase [Paraburkholderia sp. NMBU_R16]|uniref:RNA 2',3'-cyclic phosphodiesterase n=1 Tax=Paraburkholderia sp. NMBU_R16 TaxID=2698676 RepID=UPI001564C14B|nr:RNA 2',3'-cyclic phosphodiesterase [Paraburkholderia sp. NMBU_R16]NRO96398.1 RNA 2',3'-cyclic phosphodiesterase [Paraburkholderia sp. NMBU_R16]
MPVAPRAEEADWHRTFIALVPDARTRSAWDEVRIGEAAAGRRVAADQLHMTLAFLGSIPRESGQALAAGLASTVTALAALKVERFAYWPNPAHPRLAVLTFECPPPLVELQANVRELVRSLGLPIDDHRPFRPHVTLARLPRHSQPVSPEAVLAGERSALALPASRFATLMLYSSTLERSGARYRPLAAIAVPAASSD